jgi:radical SAM protein with 4Fe4S-binding SPASM domain
MISAIDIDKWIENYKWWDMMCKKYNMDVDEVVMTLEVRNNDWTDEALQHYCNYMDFLLENFKEKYNNNVVSMTDSLFSLSGQGGGYVVYAPAEAETFLGCTISNSLTVRIGDLAICPCHRTAYNKFLYGFFKQNENGRIVDIQAVNPQMAARVLYSNLQLSSFGCDACQYVDYCLRGCLGSQYENMNDPFMPISGVCKLFKTKWSHLVKRFNEYGIIDYLQTISPYHPSYLRITKFLNFAKGVLENNGLG